jgi:3-oxoacyl-[acyl-carrier-protein] synthase II
MASSWTERRVVVTGLGLVSALGQQIEPFWRHLIAGQCGVSTISSFDASAFDCRIAAEVKEFDPRPAFPSPKEVRRSDRFAQFALVAGQQALLDSGLDL